MNYWIIKSEPFKYSWTQFVADGKTYWDGVRNYQARNNLRSMELGDYALFYHSNKGKEFVGVAEVVKQAYQDPTTDDNRWVCVDVEPVWPLQHPVTLATVKADERLQEMALLKQQRLSVAPLTKTEFDIIISLSQKKS